MSYRTLTVISLMISVLFTSGNAQAAGSDQLSPSDDVIPNRFIVQSRSDLATASFTASFEMANDVRIVGAMPQIGAQLIEVPPESTGPPLISAQQMSSGVSVYPDIVTRPAGTINAPVYAAWVQWAPQRIEALPAWERTNGSDVIVAVVDSGIDPNHPDLRDQLVPGYNFYDDNTDTADGCGHGTHVAGIVAAAADNQEGIAGIAHGAKLMPVKVIGNRCSGSYGLLIAGILYAADHGAQVIVITSGAHARNPALQDAVAYARSKDVLVVAAAGNYAGESPVYPAAYDGALAVAGSDRQDGIYRRSNYGEYIDLAAPATDIISTYCSNGWSTYVNMSGTSMAAPHVAGVAALMLALNPALTMDEVETILFATAEDFGSAGWDPHYGYGRVNALRAVLAVSGEEDRVTDGEVAGDGLLFLPLLFASRPEGSRPPAQ